jgi:2'-5' RNA ligase
MQAQTIRVFIAIALPVEVTAALAQLSHTLAQQIPERAVRWVKPDRMHLTLRFLGDTAVSNLATITTELDRITNTCSPFHLHLHEVGCFPNHKRPRVIWAGLAGDERPLQALKRNIDTFLLPMGWEREKRPFQAHLTLGRVKDARSLQQVKWDVPVPKVAWEVTAVHLIESQLRPQGPIYTTRHTSHFNQST